jgi:hypothetical protein
VPLVRKGVKIWSLLEVFTLSRQNIFRVVIEVLNNRNIVTTGFNSTDNGVDSWIKKEAANALAQSSSQLSQVLPKGNNALVGQLLVTSIKDIIDFVKKNNKEFYHDGKKTFLIKTLDDIFFLLYIFIEILYMARKQLELTPYFRPLILFPLSNWSSCGRIILKVFFTNIS